MIEHNHPSPSELKERSTVPHCPAPAEGYSFNNETDCLEATCQRCHETLHDGDRYCRACGLPQLIYLPEETPVVMLAADGVAETGSGFAGLGDGIAWRLALKAALLLAIPAGVLCSGLSPLGQSLGLIWMIGAAAWAVSLYCRRARTGKLTMGAGARIGLVTGLLASWLALGVNGIALWVARYALHQGGQMDSLWATQVESSLQMSQQMVAAMGLSAAQAAQSTQFSRSLMLSAEGRAGIALSSFLAGSAFLILFAAIGGALGARLLVQPRGPSA